MVITNNTYNDGIVSGGREYGFMGVGFEVRVKWITIHNNNKNY